MEQVALTNTQLDQLASQYGGALPCDRLPSPPPTATPRGYIVNTDPAGQPGRHWLGVWTDGNACEILDSYALPLDVYETS